MIPLITRRSAVFDLELYYKVAERFTRFLEFFSYQLCSCNYPYLVWYPHNEHTPEKPIIVTRGPAIAKHKHPAQVDSFQHPDRPHHSGLIIKRMSGPGTLSTKAIKRWMRDEDHGLAHGVATAFISMWLKYPEGIPHKAFMVLHDRPPQNARDERPDNTQLMLGSMLHDFVRGSGRHEPAANHAQRLKLYFDQLEDYVYTHTEGDEKDTRPMICADRVELRRFQDNEEWIKPSFLDMAYEQLPADELDCFYRYVRPVLQGVIQFRQECWFRHGPERGFYPQDERYVGYDWRPDTLYPPHHAEMSGAKKLGSFSVEVGRQPFCGCMTHGTYCWQPWGIVPQHVVRHYGFRPMTCPLDHLILNAKIPLKEWMFLFSDTDGVRSAPGGYERHVLDSLEMFSCSKGAMGFVVYHRLTYVVDRFIDLLLGLRT
jgi:hypothetical protein